MEDTIQKFLAVMADQSNDFYNIVDQSIILDTPHHGRIDQIGEVSPIIRKLVDHPNIDLTSYTINTITSNPLNNTAAAEIEYKLINTQYPTLPIALAFDFQDKKIKSIRVYHSNWALFGEHRLRPAIFAANDVVTIPAYITDYHAALEAGNADKALCLFTNEASIREPSGGEFGSGHKNDLETFFTGAFKAGGIKLHYHSYIESSSLCAAEYTCYFWGENNIVPQAGMEFWEKDSDNRFNAVRIYDDVLQQDR